MPAAVTIESAQAVIDEQSLLEGPVRLRLDRLHVRFSHAGIAPGLPPELPVQLVQISMGRLFVRTRFTSVGGLAEITPSITPRGRLLLEVTSFKAAGLLPIPIAAVTWALRMFVPAQPGVYFSSDDHLEVSFPELLHPYGIEMPPLTGIRVDEGTLDLEFADPAINSARKAEAAARDAADPRPMSERITAQLPTELKAPTAAPLSLSFSLRNPCAELLKLIVRGDPPWVRVTPSTTALEAEESATISVEIDPANISRENYASLAVTVTWSALVTGEDSGAVKGEARIPLIVLQPPRLLLCPACDQIIHGGDPTCRHCGIVLRYCPECGAPATPDAITCAGPQHHPL